MPKMKKNKVLAWARWQFIKVLRKIYKDFSFDLILNSEFLFLNKMYKILERVYKNHEFYANVSKAYSFINVLFGQVMEIKNFERKYEELQIYKKYKNLYMCYQLDFRGRMYSHGELHHQSGDYIRNLVILSEKIILTKEGYNNLLLSIAHAYLGNKVKDEICFEFIIKNKELFKKFDFEKDIEFFKKAKNKLIFLKGCLELKQLFLYEQFIPKNIPYSTNYLVKVDCVASVGQILYIVLFRFLNLTDFEKVNLFGKRDDLTYDFYLYMINDYLIEIDSTFEKIEELWGLNKSDLRKIFKRAIMTTFYNASIYTLLTYINDGLMEVLIEKNNKSKSSSLFTNEEFNKFKEDFCIFLKKNYIYKEFSDFLKKVVDLFEHENLMINWMLPFFEDFMDKSIMVEYKTYKKKGYKVRINRSIFKGNYDFKNLPKVVNFNHYSDKNMHKKATYNAFLPNFIHSLDAFVAKCVEYRAREAGIIIFSIHDCFMIHPNDVDKIKKFYLEILVRLVDMDYFEHFLNSLKNNFKLKESKKDFDNSVLVLKKNFKNYMSESDKQILKKHIFESIDAMSLE